MSNLFKGEFIKFIKKQLVLTFHLLDIEIHVWMLLSETDNIFLNDRELYLSPFSNYNVV